MARFFLAADAWASEVWLDGDEGRHLARVMRAEPGDRVAVFDGRGRSAVARVLEVNRATVRLELGEPGIAPEPQPVVTLAQAIPKGRTMDALVQKAVELGVAAIQPLVTRRTVARPDGPAAARKWRRVALEACKQCGQDWLPTLNEPVGLETWLDSLPGQGNDDELRLIASLAEGARPMRELLRETARPARVVILVGPEGDFAHEETARALDAGFSPLSLGPLVLRVETASVCCLAGIRYEFQ
jgi:16S rRNA (uracil1498-N3)-methyltransferase